MAEADDQKPAGEGPFNREGLSDEEVVAQLAEYFRSIPGEGPKVVVLIGGPASGKGTLSARLAENLGRTAVTLMSKMSVEIRLPNMILNI